MRIFVALACVAAFATCAAYAEDSKLASGAKAVGRGIMWAPKKIASGMKKGVEALGSGAKKVVGKDK